MSKLQQQLYLLIKIFRIKFVIHNIATKYTILMPLIKNEDDKFSL